MDLFGTGDESEEDESDDDIAPVSSGCRMLSRGTACDSPPTMMASGMGVSSPADAPPPARSNVAQ
eukprot:3294223-Ditylum_brightwellii.AAC.1